MAYEQPINTISAAYTGNKEIQKGVLRDFGAFSAKALTMLVVLYLLAHYAAVLPTWAIGVIWAVLSTISALGLAYAAIISKTYKQIQFVEKGVLSKINEGRCVRFLVAFVISAAFIASLIFALPQWSLDQWILAVVAIPGYYAIYLLMKRVLTREIEPVFQTGKIILSASAITGFLLCAAYAALVLFVEPVPELTSAEAFLVSVSHPFEASSSALLSQAGEIAAYSEALIAYAQAKAATISYNAYVIGRIVVTASAFFGFASLLGVCSLTLSEIKRVFLPLESVKHPSSSAKPLTRYVVFACVLPLALVGCFLVADSEFASVRKTEEYTMTQEFLRERLGEFVYAIDGKLYEKAAVDRLLEKVTAQASDLTQEAVTTLVPLINNAFDARLANVDPYLDWYYSLSTDYERLKQFVVGLFADGMEENLQAFLQEQLETQISEGVNDSELATQIAHYTGQMEALQTLYETELANCEVTDLPAWLIVETDELTPAMIEEPLAPVVEFLNVGERLGISAGAGIVSGLVTGIAVKKIVAKPFFEKIVTKIFDSLVARGAIEVVAGTGGSVVAPGVGTIAGAVVGTVVGFAADFAMLKFDEATNRENYREEIVSAIEDSRAETLALIASS